MPQSRQHQLVSVAQTTAVKIGSATTVTVHVHPAANVPAAARAVARKTVVQPAIVPQASAAVASLDRYDAGPGQDPCTSLH